MVNHLREAEDEDRISAVVLQQAANHLKMLVDEPGICSVIPHDALRRPVAVWRRGL
jgi:hypothetical protein